MVIDTSSWISYFAGRGSAAIDEALREGRAVLTPVVAAELLSGKMARRERDALEDLLASLPLCGGDIQHWFRVGSLRAHLLAKGLSVSTPDAHVAQCALDLDAELLTEDMIFRRMSRAIPLRLA
jgi:predicted nucleic acid-binding protein